jgi:hypothetical protein
MSYLPLNRNSPPWTNITLIYLNVRLRIHTIIMLLSKSIMFSISKLIFIVRYHELDSHATKQYCNIKMCCISKTFNKIYILLAVLY